MSKPVVSLVVIACTALITLGLCLSTAEEAPTEARIVTVSRADVHQVVAITGRLGYLDERIAYAMAAGVVSRVCVEEGQRVAAGEALIRLETTQQEQVVSAWLSNMPEEASSAAMDVLDDQLAMDATVLRCTEDCTVRQLLVQENSPVAAGSPVARLSSNWQQVTCSVSTADAAHIEAGMWAWLTAEGEALGFATVTEVGAEQVDASTGLRVRTVLLQPEQHIELPEGAAVDAEVYIAGSDDVLSLPVEAITARGTVWWVDEGRCTEIPAQIVLCDEMRAWVDLPEGMKAAVGEFAQGQRVVEARP